ncbi:MAG: dihydropteroate synthase [Bacteroidales bacterium]|nr:dihydropteroate synthase [Bacteroidales bacterium]
MNRTMRCNGLLYLLKRTRVMGIVNITPDSFFAQSRVTSGKEILNRCEKMLSDGADILDIGACSTRPGADPVSFEEEYRRLSEALKVIRHEYPRVLLSLDTYRSEIVRRMTDEFGIGIINDISGGSLDPDMFSVVAELQVPYVLMHMQGTPKTMQASPCYDDVVGEVSLWFARKTAELHALGVSDIILDPGFGFGKSLEHNYTLLAHLNDFSIHDLPVLVGVSRKSMIQKLLGVTADQALNGTSAVHMAALLSGRVNFLRVHDVKEAVECIKIAEALKGNYSEF